MPSDSEIRSGTDQKNPAHSGVHPGPLAASEIAAKPFGNPATESDPHPLGQSVPDRFDIQPKATYAPLEAVTFTYYVNSSGGGATIKEVALMVGTKSGPSPLEKSIVRQPNVLPGSQQRTIDATVARGAAPGQYEVLAALYPAEKGALLSFKLNVVGPIPPLA